MAEPREAAAMRGVGYGECAELRIVRRSASHRKNSLFYRTEHGARVGDLFMSLIHTCQLADANAFEYLTELQEHIEDVTRDPSSWMPWNYQDRLAAVTSAAHQA